MKIQLLLPLLFLFVSCATELDFKMPINRMMTPETTGKTLGFEAQLTYVGSEKVSLARVADFMFSSATITTAEGIDRSRGLGTNAAIGIHERVDFYLSDSSDTSMTFGAKFQLLGSSYDKREAGSFSMAIAGGYGSGDSDEGRIVTDDNTEYTTEVQLTTFEYMLLLGYRANKNIMVYLNLFRSLHKVEAALKQNGIATKNVDGDSEMKAANLGIKLSSSDGNGFGHIELGYGYGNYEDGLKQHALTYAFSIGTGF